MLFLNLYSCTCFDFCAYTSRAISWSFDPTVRQTVWGFMIGGTVSWFMLYGLNQASVQRYSATESIVKARMYVQSLTDCMLLLDRSISVSEVVV